MGGCERERDEKKQGEKVVQSACGGVTVAVQEYICMEERPGVFSRGKGEKGVL